MGSRRSITRAYSANGRYSSNNSSTENGEETPQPSSRPDSRNYLLNVRPENRSTFCSVIAQLTEETQPTFETTVKSKAVSEDCNVKFSCVVSDKGGMFVFLKIVKMCEEKGPFSLLVTDEQRETHLKETCITEDVVNTSQLNVNVPSFISTEETTACVKEFMTESSVLNTHGDQRSNSVGKTEQNVETETQKGIPESIANVDAASECAKPTGNLDNSHALARMDLQQNDVKDYMAEVLDAVKESGICALDKQGVAIPLVEETAVRIEIDVMPEDIVHEKESEVKDLQREFKTLPQEPIVPLELKIPDIAIREVEQESVPKAANLQELELPGESVLERDVKGVPEVPVIVASDEVALKHIDSHTRVEAVREDSIIVPQAEVDKKEQEASVQNMRSQENDQTMDNVSGLQIDISNEADIFPSAGVSCDASKSLPKPDSRAQNLSPPNNTPPASQPPPAVPSVLVPAVVVSPIVVPPISITCFDVASQEDKHAKREVISVPTAVEAVVEQDESLVTLLRHVKNDLDAGIRYSIKKESDSKAAPLPIVASTDTDAALLSTSEKPESKVVLTALGTPNRVSSTTISVPAKPEEQTTQGVGLSDKPSIKKVLLGSMASPIQSPSTLRRFATKSPSNAEEPGLATVPTIRVDSLLLEDAAHYEKADEQPEKKDSLPTVQSGESSPKLRHSDSLTLIPSATPEELASGARRKIFIPKPKTEELEAAVPDPQLKKEEVSKRRRLSQDLEVPSVSPGQSRRGLAFLQTPSPQNTPPMERRSPTVSRRTSNLEVPKLYEESVDKSEMSKEVEDVKKKQDPFKAPQVIRKIRAEQFSDASGHLKLWCQFFNVLSDSTITWYKDEYQIAELKRSSGDEGQVALAIVQTTKKDCGVYKCEINNEYGTDATDCLLSEEVLSGFLLREESEVGEEIEMTTMVFTKGLADSGSSGDKFFGRIMTEEVHIGEGCTKKACKVKVIYGLDPIFESGSTCIIKVRNFIAYGTKNGSDLIERNHEITKQAYYICQMLVKLVLSGDEGQVALAIVQTTKKDCGVYKCEINNEYGTDATDCLLSEEVLSGFLLREESEVGEEIEMTTMVFTKGLADSGSSGDKFFGRIMTEEVHIGEGCTKKACKVKVIYGLDPIFESGSTCIIKVRNFIAYGTKNGRDLIERNHEITKQVSSGDEGQVALAIVQTTKKDCGVYKCEINNEYGTDATDCLLSEEVLSGFLLREESEVGEEIEMTTMVFTKGLADSGSSGDKFFGRIMTEEVHIEEGCTKKACKVKVIYGLDPIFESGSTCIIKVRNFIAYGTKNGSDLIERNHEITKQVSSGDEGQVALAIVQTTKKDCGVYKCEINNEYGTDATDCLLSEEVLSGFLLREESEVGEEIEMTTMVFTKGLADSGSSGDKFFGRIMTEEVHIGEGCTKKACKVKVIYGLDPIFESGSTCIIKVRNFIAYGTKNGRDLIERNHEITKQRYDINQIFNYKYQGLTDNCSPVLLEQFIILHQCNRYCGLLSLRPLKTTDTLQQPGKLKGSRSPLLNRKVGSGPSSPQMLKKGSASPQGTRKGTSSPKVVKKSDSGDSKTTTKHKAVEIPKSVKMR
ncbi:UNVERIFIED_CONTAM: hypothetical protein FKN15_050044 [Acipenser sinensis]